MNVIITGASGFVGKNLLPVLENDSITATPLSLRNNWQQNIPENYQSIIHLAGKAHDTKNTSGADEYFTVNTKLTQQLFGQGRTC